MSTYAIGDIQGCYQPLRCLLDKIEFNPQQDTLWIAGDLINRGPESLQALRYLYSIRHAVIAVLGNHDLHLLSRAFVNGRASKQDTLDDILHAPDRDELLDWLRHLNIIHVDQQLGFAMTHAGIPPQWTLQEAQTCAKELEHVLRSDNFKDFLSTMYGNQPDCWNDNLQGVDRLRLITNYFTRMRFCREDGTLELESKASATEAPDGFKPWFLHPHRKTRDTNIIFGHWAALEGKVNEPGIYALDTGCVWGGALTALRLEDKQLFQCSCKHL